MSILKQQFVIFRGATDISWQHEVVYVLHYFFTTVARVEQNRYKTNNRSIKHLPQTESYSLSSNTPPFMQQLKNPFMHKLHQLKIFIKITDFTIQKIITLLSLTTKIHCSH